MRSSAHLYVSVQRRPRNRKEKIVAPTARGETLIALAEEAVAETEMAMAAFLGPAVFETFIRDQARLFAFFENHEKQCALASHHFKG